MFLEELIQYFWKNTAALSAVVAPERVFTGPSPVPILPCVVILHEKAEVLFHTNRSLPWRRGTLRFELHHASLDEALGIAKIIERHFDRLRLETPDQTESFRLRHVESENQRIGDDHWKLIRVFQYFG